ncbi:translation initiation factor IF-3 [candidate division KSB1 bacterium]
MARVNEEIRVPAVRLIDEESQQVGIVNTDEAIEKAKAVGLDLVEIAPNADPPVCKIMDFGKYKYEIAKKEKDSKKKQHTITVKEIRMRPKIDTNDFSTKVRHARKFLEHGDRVKVSIMFRGRELMRKEYGLELMKTFIEAVEDIAKIETPTTSEGNTIVTVLSQK